MTTFSVWQVAATVAALAYTIRYLSVRRRLQTMPPLLPASTLGFPLLLACHLPLMKDGDRLDALAKKYGKDGCVTMWLGNRLGVYWISPEVTREIFHLKGATDGEIAKRAGSRFGFPFFREFKFILGYGHHELEWKTHRKIFMQTMTSAAFVRRSTPLFLDEIKQTLLCFSRLSRAGAFDPENAIKLAPANYVLRLCFGIRAADDAIIIGGNTRQPQADATEPTPENLLAMIQDFTTLAGRTDISLFIPQLTFLGAVHRGAHRLVKKFRAIADKLVADYQHRRDTIEDDLQSAPVLEELLHYHQKGEIDWEELQGMLFLMYLAAVDNITLLTQYVLQQMAFRPDLQRLVQQEIEELVGTDGYVKADDVAKLPKLCAVVKEVFRYRLRNTVNTIRQVGPEGLEIKGFKLQAGTNLLPSWMRSHVTNPDEFDWKRWEDNPFLDLTGQHDFNLLIFGGGPRGCPGARLANMQIMTYCGNILHFFTLVDAEGKCNDPPRLTGQLRRPPACKIEFKQRRDIHILSNY